MTIPLARIGTESAPHCPLVLGGSWYDQGAVDADITAALQASFDGGIRHFDTAEGYGAGRSETLLGGFLQGRRDQVFLASKGNPADPSGAAMTAALEGSLRRLKTDYLDLYYIHWPQSGVDMRPRMEALEKARAAGKIRAVGVSNFSVAQMAQVQKVGQIDAHQLGYNLLWRMPERELIPYCESHGIAVVTYSTLAHGILTGKFGADPGLAPGDQRGRVPLFRPDVWPHLHAAVEEMKALAAPLDRPLMDLALRWTLAQPGVTAVIAGARNAAQARANIGALSGDIPASTLTALTAISDRVAAHVPDVGNLFNHHP